MREQESRTEYSGIDPKLLEAMIRKLTTDTKLLQGGV